MTDHFWKPDKAIRAAIRRGDKKEKEARKRIADEIERERIARQSWREYGSRTTTN